MFQDPFHTWEGREVPLPQPAGSVFWCQTSEVLLSPKERKYGERDTARLVFVITLFKAAGEQRRRAAMEAHLLFPSLPL